MQPHRFFVNSNLQNKLVILKDKILLDQVRRVLRLNIGDKLILCDGNKNESLGEIISLKNNFLGLRIIDYHENNNEPSVVITLYCSILKRENFEWVVQKATEIGIKSIVPIITERTVKTNLNQARLEKIAKEAAEQSGRGIIPEISAPQVFKDALTNSKSDKLNLFFDPSGEVISKIGLKSAKSIGIWIGPEGGWTDDEILEAKRHGFKIVSLGSLTLRAETAAVIASYLVSRNEL